MHKYIIIFIILQLISVGCTEDPDRERWAMSSKDDGILRLVSWNIGHYSDGLSAYSQINEQNYDEERAIYHKFIHYLDADIICLSEYSHIFAYVKRRQKLSRKVLFSEYCYIYEYPQYNFSCNAVMSNILISDLYDYPYYFNDKQDNAPTGPVNYEDYYFLKGQIKLSDKNVTVIFTHLAFDDTETGRLQQQQIEELINICKDDEYVILAGDWNTEDYSLFMSNGYNVLCSKDDINGTYPSHEPAHLFDNIIVKGLEYKNVKIIESDLSDHLPIVVDLYIH